MKSIDYQSSAIVLIILKEHNQDLFVTEVRAEVIKKSWFSFHAMAVPKCLKKAALMRMQ